MHAIAKSELNTCISINKKEIDRLSMQFNANQTCKVRRVIECAYCMRTALLIKTIAIEAIPYDTAAIKLHQHLAIRLITHSSLRLNEIMKKENLEENEVDSASVRISMAENKIDRIQSN